MLPWQEDDVDPLDAFMNAAVNPEVAAAEKAEAARKEELRKEQVKALAVSTTSSSSQPVSKISLLRN